MSKRKQLFSRMFSQYLLGILLVPDGGGGEEAGVLHLLGILPQCLVNTLGSAFSAGTINSARAGSGAGTETGAKVRQLVTWIFSDSEQGDDVLT